MVYVDPMPLVALMKTLVAGVHRQNVRMGCALMTLHNVNQLPHVRTAVLHPQNDVGMVLAPQVVQLYPRTAILLTLLVYPADLLAHLDKLYVATEAVRPMLLYARLPGTVQWQLLFEV